MAGGILLKNLLETVGLIILSMGGAGAIIMSVSSFLANKIATRLEQKYKLTIVFIKIMKNLWWKVKMYISLLI